jgi:hypothetical protein
MAATRLGPDAFGWSPVPSRCFAIGLPGQVVYPYAFFAGRCVNVDLINGGDRRATQTVMLPGIWRF